MHTLQDEAVMSIMVGPKLDTALYLEFILIPPKMEAALILIDECRAL